MSETFLGEGNFGQVYEVSKEGKRFAIKVLRVDDASLIKEQMFVGERFFLRFFKTINFFLDLHLLFWFHISHLSSFVYFFLLMSVSVRLKDNIFLVMELCRQGSLRSLMDKANGLTPEVFFFSVVLLMFAAVYENLHPDAFGAL
jgi:serine/threonine protein kinase